MKLTKLITIFTALLFVGSMHAQDVHFSYTQFSPLTLNPALTGAFYGTVRVGGIVRDQGRSVSATHLDQYAPGISTSNSYFTYSLYVDSPVVRGIKKNDWIGVGFSLYSDKAGASGFGNSQGISPSLAYHLALDKKATTVISLGFQYAAKSYTINNADNLVSRPTILNGIGSDPDLERDNFIVEGAGTADEKIKTALKNLRIGALLTTQMGDNSDLRAGVSMGYITTPDFMISRPDSTTMGNQPFEFPRIFNTFVELYTNLSDKLMFRPALYVQNSAQTTEILLQGMTSYLLNPAKELSLNAGLGLRPSNSMDLILYLGADIKSFRMGLSFDANLSGLNPATSGFGAMEIGVGYIKKIYKKPKVKPATVCPRL